MAKKHKRKLKSKRTLRPRLKTSTIYSIVQVVFFSLSALVVISFTRRGLALEKFNELLIFLFGKASIFLPFTFVSFGLLVSKIRSPLGSPNVVVGNIIFITSLMALFRTGVLGRSLWDGFETLLTGFGAFVVFVAAITTSIIIMFNTSLDSLVLAVVSFFKQFGIRGKLKGVSGSKVFAPRFDAKKDIKLVGDETKEQDFAGPKVTPKPEILEQKLVSNLPNEEKVWIYPDVSILSDAQSGKADRGDIKGNADIIEHTLESFGITARVVEVNLGPAVTQYALEVALGTKLSKITALEKDLARALASPTGTIRIEAPIPGRSLVGIEFPNRSLEFVTFRRMIESSEMREKASKLAVALGLDVSGKPVVADLAKMPHVLIAGQTGSGKSVAINTFLSSILFRASPSEVKLILVDPKRVELINYNNIPHLLSPVIVEPNKVISALRWLVGEMDRRYKLFAQSGVRNIDAYNEMSGFQALPFIVLFIDELADIMLFSPVEVEETITRIAQMSRATGIHMVLATQRPSVDVITGLIKANIPCRIAFAVASQVDSRVILDSPGAEKLLGRGDMLYLPPDQAKPIRIQGAFISDKDTNALVSFLKNQGVSPQYTEEVVSMPKPGSTVVPGTGEEVDPLFKEAVAIVCQYKRASSSLLQRRMSIGYARAARIVDQLERAGVIGPQEGSKPREVLIKSPDEIFSQDQDNIVS